MPNEQFLEDLCEAAQALDLMLVHDKATSAIERLKVTDDLWNVLRSGVNLPKRPGAPPSSLLSSGWNDVTTGQPKGIGLVSRDPSYGVGKRLPAVNLPNAGIVSVVSIVKEQKEPAVEATVEVLGEAKKLKFIYINKYTSSQF